MEFSIESMLERRSGRKAYGGGTLALGTVVGDWKVAAFVGDGGSAEVYRVVGTKMDSVAALKILVNEKTEYRERFMHEMEVMRSLAVPSIPRYLGSGEFNSRPWYAMEYLQPVVLPADDPLSFALALASAVTELHKSGYVHCDLKPSNILRRADGRLVLADLGLVTKNGEKGKCGVGTKGYAAPEQLIDGIASVRGDVFSMGKILKEAMAGRSTHRLGAVVRKATHEDPVERYGDAGEFAKALGATLSKRILVSSVVFLSLMAIAFVLPHPAALTRRARENQSPRETSAPLKFDDWLALAEKGDVNAQAKVAESYFHGDGTGTNREEAVRWYSIAAETGHPGAMDSLGICRLYGYGCARDPESAAKLFSEAAAMNHLSAMNNLAFCYMHGIGIAKDERKAFKWASAAADREHAPSQTMVAECYMDGRGVEKDETFARMWLERAAKNGNRRAKRLLEQFKAGQ